MVDGVDVYMDEVIRSFAQQMTETAAAAGPGLKDRATLFAGFNLQMRQLVGMARAPLEKQVSGLDARVRSLEGRLKQLEG